MYASQPGSPPDHATLGSGWLLAFAGQGYVLLGPTEGFHRLHDFLLLQASLAHHLVEREVRQAVLSAAPTPLPQSEPLTPDLRRLHMTVSKQFLEKLEAARKGQGHAQPGATSETVLEAALDLLLAQQAKRRAEAKTPQQNPRPAKNPRHVPAAVKRAVWARDEGKCQFPLDSGGICGSTLRLEIDHIRPLARGGQSTVANCRLACRFHNQRAARQVYGDDWMDRFIGGTGITVPVAREAAAPWTGRSCEGLRAVLETHAFPALRRHSSAGRATDS